MVTGRSIFLTGFPGFIAERLVGRLCHDAERLYLLVQPQFFETAQKAVDELAAAHSVPAERFVLLAGDITKPGLGIDKDVSGELTHTVTDVFHLAAVYDLAVDKELAFSVNLEGTQNVNEFVRSLSALRRYNYISTCYVAGQRQGRIYEADLRHHEGFRNFYEETKYLAEIEVEKLKDALPVTIFRPSVVVGDSHTGETAKYDGIYYLIQYLRKAPHLLRLINVGNSVVRLNLVPVDFVVEGIAELSRDEAARGLTVALADPSPLTTAELFNLIAREMTGKGSALTPPQGLVRSFLMLPVSPPITGLPHAGVPYFFLSQTYDTDVADRLLAPHGIKCPDLRDYMGILIDFVNKHPTL